MFGLVRRKTHEEALHQWGVEEHAHRAEENRLLDIIIEQDKILNSTERAKVLANLEEALNLIEAYQRALSILSASDPNIIRANAFLEKFNRKGDPNATILGAKPEFEFDPTRTKKVPGGMTTMTRQEQEEEYWGDEAYGSGMVRIEAVPIDEGELKEPGYTRATIRFVDAAPEELAVLAAARSTTDDASDPTLEATEVMVDGNKEYVGGPPPLEDGEMPDPYLP